MAKKPTKVMVWNVNGLRSCRTKGFDAWLEGARPDVFGLQEVRAFPEQLADAAAGWRSAGYEPHFAPATRPGYAGVALLLRRPAKVTIGMGEPRFDAEGRVIAADFGDWMFVNVYFPKGSGKDRDNSRVPFKLEFYAALLEKLEAWRKKRPIVVAGDYNTAHQEIDLRNWKTNQKTSGFLPEERAEFGRWLDAGYVDVFRAAHPDEEGHYTWWSQRMGARARNVGWRIDYLLVTRELATKVRRAWLEPEVRGSDHCPAGIELAV